ncbi:MAG: LCP family protein [Clostridium sp.]|uniref:LCP family protein n=1 Tax=Clostridium sp. TaxID=1506 RepID=UPI003F2DA818
MADDRNSMNSSRRRRAELDREERIRKKRRMAKRNEELNMGKKPRRRLDSESIPLDDSRRRVDSKNRRIPANDNGKRDKDRRPSKAGKKKKKGKIKRIIKIILVALLALIVLLGFRIVKLVNNISTDNMIAPVEVPMDQTVNILLLGMDVGNIDNPSDESQKRTDTMMVINYNPTTKKVKMISIPRDTLITINGRNWKMNAAYPIGGDQRVITEVQELLNIKINYLAKINYEGFRDFIDAIGGVDMKIENNMDYTDKSQNLRIKFNKGEVAHLDGKKAEEFFRWRKNNDGTGLPNGDIDRIKNQHAFLEQVVKKCTSPAIVFRIPKILESVEKNVETNMKGKTMFKYALRAALIKPSNVSMETIKGSAKMIDGQSYFIFNKAENDALLRSLHESSDSTKSMSQSDVRIQILNGTKISGLAATYQIQLKQLGYTNVDVGNTDSLRDKSIIMVDDPNIKKMLKKDFDSITDYGSIDSKFASPNYDVVIVLGSDAKSY